MCIRDSTSTASRAAGAASRSILLPASVTDRGLPFGVTFIGPAQADAALARWGQRWQAQVAQPLGATGRAWVAPDTALPWPATRATLPIAVVGAHLSGLDIDDAVFGAMIAWICLLYTSRCV